MNRNVGMHPGASESNHTAPSTPAYVQGTSPNERMHRSASLPQRKNLRAKFHNYSGGEYFVTICTDNKSHYFGEIRNGEMTHSAIGRFADEAMKTLATHYSYVEVPLWVVMPNHVHAIICIREKADAPGCIPTQRTALGVVVGGYKQSVTRFARRNGIEFDWQKRYHDHIIRGNHDGNIVAGYIENNVARWSDDCFFPMTNPV